MKISFFLFTNIRAGRGTENVVLNLVKYRPKDVSISIIQTDLYDKIRLSDEYINGITEGCEMITFHRNEIKWRFRGIGIYLNIVRGVEYKDLKSLKKTSILEKIRSTDVVYLLYNNYAIFFDKMKIPIIASDHTNSISKVFKKDRFLNMVYQKLHYIIYYKNINGCCIFPSNNYLLEKIPFRYKMVLPNGVETQIFQPSFDLTNKKIKFLFVAALDITKGLDILLPVIEKVDSFNVEFNIVGTGPLKDEISKNKKIIYHGILDDVDLARLYRECDVFIYPSHSDAFPLVVLEALSSGLYVLAGDYLRGIFDDFDGKYLEYIPMDVSSFYKRVLDISRDRKIIEHDKRDEYDYVKKNYDWSIIADKFYGYMRKFYEESRDA